MRIDVGTLIDDCRSAVASAQPTAAVREIVARTVRERGSLAEALGRPTRGGIYTLHHSPELTILNVVWSPNMSIMPHDHRMWAVIGIYGGREDNDFWRRVPGPSHGTIERIEARTLSEGDTAVLESDVIHSVTNPTSELACAIHVYGGDFFRATRSEWDSQSLKEQPFDPDRAQRLFEGSN